MKTLGSCSIPGNGQRTMEVFQGRSYAEDTQHNGVRPTLAHYLSLCESRQEAECLSLSCKDTRSKRVHEERWALGRP